MKKNFSQEQIISLLKENEQGIIIADILRKNINLNAINYSKMRYV